MFKRRHALPLDASRILCPRESRGKDARFPRGVHNGGHKHFQFNSTSVPRHCRHIAGQIPNHFQNIPVMSPPFNPIEARAVVAQFTTLRPRKFQSLSTAKEVIMELRQKGASYQAVAELLTRLCLKIGKTHVAAFCHEVLGESIRHYKRRSKKRSPAPLPMAGRISRPQPIPASDSKGNETPPARVRGPRIAQVRMLKPQNP